MAEVVVLHLPAGALCTLLLFGGVPSAWAEETAPGSSEGPVTAPSTTIAPQPETETLPTSCDEPSEPKPGELPAEETKPLPPEVPALPDLRKTVPEFIDLLHGELSHEFLTTAGWLDSFFGDERYVLEENRSYFRFRYDVFAEEAAATLFKPAVDLRLALPQLEKKTHIVFSAEPSATPAGTGTPVTTPGEATPATGQSFAAPETRNLTSALLYILRSMPRESIIVRTGVQLSQGKPVIFGSPRYRALIPLGAWDFRFTQEALYRTDTQWQTDTRFDFERKLPHDLFFRASIDGVWLASTAGYTYSHSVSLRQPFGATHALDYEWINVYHTRPSMILTEVAFRIRYRHSFWREWLFFELAPQIRYPEDRKFDDTPGILFRLEVFFGRQAG
jgi:hypothetical protein